MCVCVCVCEGKYVCIYTCMCMSALRKPPKQTTTK